MDHAARPDRLEEPIRSRRRARDRARTTFPAPWPPAIGANCPSIALAAATIWSPGARPSPQAASTPFLRERRDLGERSCERPGIGPDVWLQNNKREGLIHLGPSPVHRMAREN